VIHVAGRVRGRDAADFLPVNAEGVARVARLAQEARSVARLVLISSLAAREPRLSPYAASKRAGEDRLAGVSGEGGLSCAVLRPPPIYGPNDRELLPLFRLMARGIAPMPRVAGARASLLHVEDLARATARLLDSPAQGIYELHDGHAGGYGWDEIASIVERVAGRGRGLRLRLPGGVLRPIARVNLVAARCLGYLPMLSPGKINELFHRDWVCDNTDITRATGWQPGITLQDGLPPLLGKAPVPAIEGKSNVT
jgi:nucleoside-diphosphate-sugar epimerase